MMSVAKSLRKVNKTTSPKHIKTPKTTNIKIKTHSKKAIKYKRLFFKRHKKTKIIYKTNQH
jgi:hypothetical protein